MLDDGAHVVVHRDRRGIVFFRAIYLDRKNLLFLTELNGVHKIFYVQLCRWLHPLLWTYQNVPLSNSIIRIAALTAKKSVTDFESLQSVKSAESVALLVIDYGTTHVIYIPQKIA
jgi:hypothetical protein